MDGTRYRPVAATGEYLPQQQILIDNKVQAGRAGYHVVTPLKLSDGRVVLVDRGWIAQHASRSELPGAPPPAGQVTVHGRLALAPAAYLELKPDSTAGPIRQNLDPARFAARRVFAVLPAIIEATAAPVARRRARARVARAGLRHRDPPDLHGAVVLVRAARRVAVALVPSPARGGRAMTERRRPTGPRCAGDASRQRAAHAAAGSPLVTLAPVVASYTAYYFFPREPAANYGTLLPTAPIAGIEGTRPDGSPFRLDELRGRWVLLALARGDCDAGCERRLYATRQARTMQGKEQDRVARVFLVGGDAVPPAALLAQHPGLVTARVTGCRRGEISRRGRDRSTSSTRSAISSSPTPTIRTSRASPAT